MYAFIMQPKNKKEYKVLKYRNRIFVIDLEDNSYKIYTKEQFFLNFNCFYKYIYLNRKD